MPGGTAGTSTAKGPWSVNVVTIDPNLFHGSLGSTFGPTIEARETTSWLAGYTKAKAAVNGGFFVLDPAAGAPGDPAGAGVYDGTLESEPVGTRPVLVLRADAKHTEIARPQWHGDALLPSGAGPRPWSTARAGCFAHWVSAERPCARASGRSRESATSLPWSPACSWVSASASPPP